MRLLQSQAPAEGDLKLLEYWENMGHKESVCLGSYSVRQSRSTILLLDRLLSEQDPRHTLYQSAA